MTKLFRTLLLVALLSVAAFAQSTLTTTTLSADITASTQTITIGSATGWSASSSSASYLAFVDKEAMKVIAISGTSITVQRGIAGTAANAHLSGSLVYFAQSGNFLTVDPSGKCTSTNHAVLPKVSLKSGSLFDCIGSKWYEIGGKDGYYVEAVFCGDLANSGTLYMSPVSGYADGIMYSDGLTATDLAFDLAGTGCAAEDNATEATADEVMYGSSDFHVVGMACTVTSSGSNGVTLSVRDDAGDTTPSIAVTIPTSSTTGSTSRRTSAKVAAGSTVAVKSVTTEDLSAQDVWCTVKLQVFP
jgi:hypothetical protein